MEVAELDRAIPDRKVKTTYEDAGQEDVDPRYRIQRVS